MFLLYLVERRCFEEQEPIFVVWNIDWIDHFKCVYSEQRNIFQPDCSDLLSNVQELKDMVPQLMSKDISENQLQSSRPFLGVEQKVKVFKKPHSGSKTIYNLCRNILKLFDVLPNFPFTTSERNHDYY